LPILFFMSPRKIIFMIVISVFIIWVIGSVFYLSNKSEKKKVAPQTMKVWITDWTTESYKDIIAGFKAYAPDYKNTNIVFEKKTSDPVRYRTLLLSTMTDETGPDIFVVPNDEDAVIKEKVEPIPASLINIDGFEKRYEDIFLPLIFSTGAKWQEQKYIYGVPLGYETLGIFYNKSLLREVPKTWNDIDNLYGQGGGNGVYPTNLGLGPRYTPNMADILGLLFIQNEVLWFDKIESSNNQVSSYMNYGTKWVWWTGEEGDIYAGSINLANKKQDMDNDKLTTYDLFMQWDISMILWYPSIVLELEKSAKRAWANDASKFILTERAPVTQKNNKEIAENIAKYQFFWVSKASKNGEVAAKFLEYLMTEEAERIYIKENPYMIPALRSFYASVEGQKLSEVLSRTTLDAFIPWQWEILHSFNYWLKSEFERFLDEYIDRNENMDMNNITSLLSKEITCALETYHGNEVSDICEKKTNQ